MGYLHSRISRLGPPRLVHTSVYGQIPPRYFAYGLRRRTTDAHAHPMSHPCHSFWPHSSLFIPSPHRRPYTHSRTLRCVDIPAAARLGLVRSAMKTYLESCPSGWVPGPPSSCKGPTGDRPLSPPSRAVLPLWRFVHISRHLDLARTTIEPQIVSSKDRLLIRAILKTLSHQHD